MPWNKIGAKILVAASVVAVIPNPALADIFFDDFQGEGNAQILNYNAFEKWNVSNGTVDLLATTSGYCTPTPGNMCVDLDGSTLDAGIMTTKDSFLLAPGLYNLTLELRGSINPILSPVDSLAISVGSVFSTVATISWNDPCTLNTADGPQGCAGGNDTKTLQYLFSLNSPAAASIVLDHAGGDQAGIILESVKLSTVPEPRYLSFFVVAIAAGMFYRRASEAKRRADAGDPENQRPE
jgi:hypothetical protein